MQAQQLPTNADVALPRGATWSVHKFGGTCVGTPDRIHNVAKIINSDDSVRKLIVVSAMSKVTDMMYNLLDRAQARDDAYLEALEEVHAKHIQAAEEVFGVGEGARGDLEAFLRRLEEDVQNLGAMLKAISIGEKKRPGCRV